MATNRDMVSRVRSQDKLISGDASITDRVILRELRSNSITFIKQQLDKRRGWETSTIFSNIPCVQLKEVPAAECCDYVSNITFARSLHRLPKIGDGTLGLAIQGVFSVDQGIRVKETTISRYINSLRLGFTKPELFYWIYDRYLFLSSPLVQLVNIWAFFEEDIPDYLLYPEDCPCNKMVKDPCINPLDLEFKCPGFLEKGVVDATLKLLLETYYRVPVDHTSDNKDDQTNKT
jgi:hypothetical protein